MRPCHERSLCAESRQVIAAQRNDAICRNRTWHLSFCPARGFATSRAQSMKSCASGLSARFSGRRFRLAGGPSVVRRANLDLRALGGKSQCGSRENRNEAPGYEEACPHLGGFGDHSRAGIIEPAGAKRFPRDRRDHASGAGSTRASLTSSQANLAPPHPRIMRAGRDDIGVIGEKFEIQCSSARGPNLRSDQEIDVTFAQFSVQCLHMSGHEMKHDARIAPREPLDDGGNEACGQQGAASIRTSPVRRVGEKLDILQRLAQVIEHRAPPSSKARPYWVGSTPCGLRSTRSYANGVFQFGD